MPTPTTSSSVSSVRLSSSSNINALLDGEKWGGGVGTGVSLTYSFPWANSTTAVFAGPNGIGSYSSLNEQNAAEHFGLTFTQQSAARQALASWANVANIQYSEVFDTPTNVGDIRFAWTSEANSSSDGGAAWGWSYMPDGRYPCAGDIWINSGSSAYSDSDWSSGSYNYSSLIHELGHAFGLKHSFEDGTVLPASQDSLQYTIMSYTDSPNGLFVDVDRQPDGGSTLEWFYVQPDTPMLYDIAAMQYLYGANMTYHTWNDVYTFDPDVPFMRTIWDAGGIDTITVSNFSKGCMVDLRDGAFSKITIESDSPAGIEWTTEPPEATYDGTNNLAIAYGCAIECAIGGLGHDSLIGNKSANTLTGNGGNDFLDGQGGIDVAAYSGGRNNYLINPVGQNLSVTNSADGVDTLANIERLKFSDTMLALDLQTTGNAGQAMEFIGTIAPQYLNSVAVRGSIITLLDQGNTLHSLSQMALDLGLVPKSSDLDLVKVVYGNVIGGVPDHAMTETLMGYVKSHGQAEFLATVAGLHINIDLVGLQASGLEYTI